MLHDGASGASMASTASTRVRVCVFAGSGSLVIRNCQAYLETQVLRVTSGSEMASGQLRAQGAGTRVLLLVGLHTGLELCAPALHPPREEFPRADGALAWLTGVPPRAAPLACCRRGFVVVHGCLVRELGDKPSETCAREGQSRYVLVSF